MKTALLGESAVFGTRVLLGGVGTHIGELNMLKNGDITNAERQQVSLFDVVDDLDFTSHIVEFFGVGHLVEVARYAMDKQAHVEIAGPLPRGWQRMIPARGRHRGMLRLGWRNSRGKQLLHPIDFSQAVELAAELAEQRAARRAA